MEIRARGCGCLLWSTRGERALRGEMLLRQGIVSAELATSPATAYSHTAADTVIVGLTARRLTFDVGESPRVDDIVLYTDPGFRRPCRES